MEQELHSELAQSEKLKKHFKKHPSDLVAVEHGNNNTSKYLKRKFKEVSDIPDYLVTPANETEIGKSDKVNEVAIDQKAAKKKAKKQLQKETLDYYRTFGLLKPGGSKKNKDPLKSL